MMKIRRMGSFKPWEGGQRHRNGSVGYCRKSCRLPVYKLLEARPDQVRVYNGGIRFPMTGISPDDYASNMAKMKASPEGFSIIKQGISFHSGMPWQIPNSYDEPRKGLTHANRGLLTEKSMKHIIACVEAMKSVLGDEVGLAWTVGRLDCRMNRVAKALEPLNLMWLEDMITGDYMPYVLADVYREVTQATSTPVHTGEQIYLRHNFRELIESHAVRVIGPDPADVGNRRAEVDRGIC
jgi:L-alanine-DL-glutamate epimerase-like enolase superfamily enzyme